MTGDFTRADYVALQEVVHAADEAIRAVLPTERLYVLSLDLLEVDMGALSDRLRAAMPDF